MDITTTTPTRKKHRRRRRKQKNGWSPDLFRLIEQWHNYFIYMSHKHEEASEYQRRVYWGLSITVIILGFFTGTSIFSTSDSLQQKSSSTTIVVDASNGTTPYAAPTQPIKGPPLVAIVFSYVAGAMASVCTILAGINTFINPGERMTGHSDKGSRYDFLTKEIEVEVSNLDTDNQMNGKEFLQKLLKDYKELDKMEPKLPSAKMLAPRNMLFGNDDDDEDEEYDESSSKKKDEKDETSKSYETPTKDSKSVPNKRKKNERDVSTSPEKSSSSSKENGDSIARHPKLKSKNIIQTQKQNDDALRVKANAIKDKQRRTITYSTLRPSLQRNSSVKDINNAKQVLDMKQQFQKRLQVEQQRQLNQSQSDKRHRYEMQRMKRLRRDQ